MKFQALFMLLYLLTTLFFRFLILTKLNSEVAKAQSWKTANRLTITVTITEMLLISNRNKPDVDHQIAINGDFVRYTNSV